MAFTVFFSCVSTRLSSIKLWHLVCRFNRVCLWVLINSLITLAGRDSIDWWEMKNDDLYLLILWGFKVEIDAESLPCKSVASGNWIHGWVLTFIAARLKLLSVFKMTFSHVLIKLMKDFCWILFISPVTIYKCEKMASDCSSCLSLQEMFDTVKYNCHWCSDRCQSNLTCGHFQLSSICPLPDIQTVLPYFCKSCT